MYSGTSLCFYFYFFKQSKRIKHLKSIVISFTLSSYNVQGNTIAHLEEKINTCYIQVGSQSSVQAGNKPFFPNYLSCPLILDSCDYRLRSFQRFLDS